ARVNQPAGLPAVTQHPQPRVVPTNGNASFSVAVCGTPPFTYQWLRDGTPLNGETNATLLIVNAQLDDAGGYTVVVANTSGSVTSEVAQLVVQIPPVVLRHPAPVTVIRDQTAVFEVAGGGSAPFSYQWQHNGNDIPGATTPTLVLTNVQAAQAGSYRALVFNTAGAVASSNALLTVLIPATITNQPASQTVTNGATVTLTVGAYGSGALRYQWSKDGVNLPDATNATLVLPEVQVANAGIYRVTIWDAIGPAVSQPAELVVLVRPTILIHPVSQALPRGGTLILGVKAEGTMPMGFRWRRNGATLFMETNSTGVSYLVENNVTSNGTYQVIVTNTVNRGGIAALSATVTVLADFDGDGVPDAWEAAYNLNTNDVADAAADADGDSLSNREEYIAGTDPRDPASCLKFERIEMVETAGSPARLSFLAVSNRTYTVQWRPSAGAGEWTDVDEVFAYPSNRVIEILHPSEPDQPRRFYRLVTPRNP
ncbi:MAG TPA: immunoglobulin domain-containing protein, partial [Methylomirabilota bacterium]|nr:immunoglobulin domain-containing protein [Methylomirabilota bacterium]